MRLLLDTQAFLWFTRDDPRLSRRAAELIEDPVALSSPRSFDRLLIAQSQVESVPILGADSAFDLYGIHRLW